MRQSSPYDLAVPCSAISAFRKEQPLLCELMHHSIGATGFSKEAEYQCDGASYFFIRIQDDAPFVVVAKTDRE